jgi:hypothetical protein
MFWLNHWQEQHSFQTTRSLLRLPSTSDFRDKLSAQGCFSPLLATLPWWLAVRGCHQIIDDSTKQMFKDKMKRKKARSSRRKCQEQDKTKAHVVTPDPIEVSKRGSKSTCAAI